jgi:electron transport complex protein RnfG
MLDDQLAAPMGDPLLRLPGSRSIFRARRDGEVIAVILPAYAPDGYSGGIEMVVGVNRDGSIAGVRVLEHRETPGLGDAVDYRKSNWVDDFRGKALGKPPADGWAVRKDGGIFDQFTGATITPRAVIDATRRTLEYVQAEHARLFEDPSAAQEEE